MYESFRWNMWSWMWIWPVIMLLLWGIFIAGAVSVFKWLFKQTPRREESAMDILNKRYAKGEIGREEFEEKKRAIS